MIELGLKWENLKNRMSLLCQQVQFHTQQLARKLAGKTAPTNYPYNMATAIVVL